jgi:hypothetical protein
LENKVKSTETKNIKRNSTTNKPAQLTPVSEQERFDCICTAAYYKACERQFSPGHELDDWLVAEAEFDSRS